MIVGNTSQPEQFQAGFDFQTNSRQLPKTVRIVVHKGQGLSYRVPGSVEKESTMHWRLIFHGGAKKLASEAIESSSGSPEWNCEVTINTKNPSDPIIILVEDKKRRPVGQVLLNLQDIPCRPLPELYTTNLEKAKLMATKKNSYPCGSIYYWIGTDEYWDADAVANASLYKSVSLRKSLSSIGSALFKIGRKDKDDSKSTMSGMSRMKQLREKTRGKSHVGSYLGQSEYNLSRSNTGASNQQLSRNSSVTSLSKNASGWSGNGSILTAQDGRSYNPIADSDSDIDDHNNPFSNTSQQLHKMKASSSAINLEHSATASPADKAGFLKKMKSKLNRSTQNLSQAIKSPKQRSKDNRNSKTSVYDEVPNFAASQSRQPSEIDSANPFGVSDSEDQPTRQQQTNETEPFTIRTSNGPASKVNNGPKSHSRALSAGSDLFQLMNGTDNISTLAVDSQWGLHPEERTEDTRKSIATMTRPEILNYIKTLLDENERLKKECGQIITDRDKFKRDFESASRELGTVRAQLGDLRLRLLKDNQAQYLEVGPGVKRIGDEEANDHKEQASASLSAKQNGQGSQAPNLLRALANAKNEDAFNWWG